MGAFIIKNEYEKFIEENKQKIYISTCCPSINYYISKYHEELKPYLIKLQSPMIAHGRYLKQKYGSDIKTVFIGPCISKKNEAIQTENRGSIDRVVRFDEIFNYIKSKSIDINSLEETDFDNDPLGPITLFPIEKSLSMNMSSISVSGMDNVKDLMQSIKKEEISNLFIELNSCTGSCVGGIGFKNKKGIHYRQTKVIEYAKLRNTSDDILEKIRLDFGYINLKKDFDDIKLNQQIPEEMKIREILISIGKKTIKDELNCGACGYDTCRDKAIAVVRGLAEPYMCIPYMKDRVEALSNVIFEVSPNYIVIVGEDFKIIDINSAMIDVIQKDKKDIIGAYIGDYIDIGQYIDVLYDKNTVIYKKFKWKEFDKDLTGNVIHLKEHRAIIGIYNDVTSEENQKKMFKEVKLNTINTAQNVIEKQMRVAQEIASLLGETTAETKVILTRLKELAMKGDE